MGSLERSHHSLIEYLTTNQADWEIWIKFAFIQYVYSAHYFTPHELIFEIKARIPSEFENKVGEKTYAMNLDELISKLNETQREAWERLIEAEEKSKRYYCQKLNVPTYKVGEEVYLLQEPQLGKLDE